MSDWDAQQYLQFQRQRTQPAVDLIARIIAQPEGRFQPNSILDIGCGPGNSTAALKAAFPGAKLLGLDSSRQVKAAYPVTRSGEVLLRFRRFFLTAKRQ